ncbi:Mediator of RNA polymerase II transcription subunit 8 [Dichanthelium oligosanthes]|uniref:Mediator of RNA polymerase II transcription subunit 8 n=1 Tax=Dichanthelium oligosanthes TaxID=888268 RepID=A0A1E5VPU5_9POAL|nr:Mediator of RNA polymerase II transcription subunit 8 [Dichanthelium oligosanthes]
MDAAAALGAGPAAGAPPPGAATGEQQGGPRVERLSAGVQQQLNLEGMRARAVGLYKAISRILEDFDVIARTNPAASPKWQDVLGQFSMVSMELFNIVEDIKNVSKVFVVYPRNVNAENATILPVMLSSKLLPQMEVEETTKREQLLSGITNLPVPTQIEKIKVRIDMIGSACETAEKVIAECRKSYGLGTRQGTNLVPTLDKAQAAKIQEQEGLLRAAVNFGEGGYPKNSSTFAPSGVNTQGNPIQASGGQLLGRPAPSPGTTGTPNFENVSTPPMPYANSPRSGTNMMNTPSPQQQLTPQQQRQKLMQASQQQQLHAQQQLRPSAAGMLAQVPGQQQMQYNQALSQQFHNRQMQPGHGKCAWNNAITVAYATNAVFGMGGTNSSMMGMQQQQQQQGVYGNMQAGVQNMQQGMVGLQNQGQNPNFPQQRQQNQQ